jgi:hypothetical protein
MVSEKFIAASVRVAQVSVLIAPRHMSWAAGPGTSTSGTSTGGSGEGEIVVDDFFRHPCHVANPSHIMA